MTAIPFLVDPLAYYGRELREPPPCVRGECAGEYVGMSAVEVWERQGVRNQMERRPRLLDLFCGAGGCSVGYHRAGFDVVGVDVKPQPRYPFEFIQGDALEFLAEHGREFDAIHASPPCQAYSMAAQSQRNSGKEYPDLIAATREALERSGKRWVIENVPGAPLRPDFRLCGCQFRLPLRRVRLFETSWNALALTPSCQHDGPVVSVVGHGTPSWVREKLGFNPTVKHYREAMGIDWMNCAELSQAIPPAYTEWIGKQLLGVCRPAQVPVDMVFDERGLRTLEGNGNG